MNVFNTKNYLVPSSGNTHAVAFNQNFSIVPFFIDWRQFNVDNFPFIPQGVFIDNSQGISSIVINVQPINYNIVCPAGIVGQFQFPSPDNQTCTIVGNGNAAIVFVDFPVLPNAGILNIGNVVTVSQQVNPLPVSLPIGAPVSITPISASRYYNSLSGATLTNSVTPTVNTNLREAIITISGNAALAAPGLNIISLTLNAILIFTCNIYLGATAQNTQIVRVPFESISFNSGAGNLTLSSTVALTAGVIECNSYFA